MNSLAGELQQLRMTALVLLQAALMDLRIPHLDVSMGEEGDDPELDLDDNPELAASLDTSRVPVIVTVSQVRALIQGKLSHRLTAGAHESLM